MNVNAKPKKVLVIGIDQAIPYLLKKFMSENLLPNISNLVNLGVLAEAYSCPPCDTPTNWTTIATGATTAVHGATSFYVHVPGEPLDYGLKIRSRSSLSRFCNAEYFWDVADKNGLKSFVLNYPSGWPGNLKNGVISLLTWPLPESLPREITSPILLKYSIDSSDPTYKIKVVDRVNNDLKSHSSILQITIEISHKNIEKFPAVIAYILDENGDGYDSLAISPWNENQLQIIKLNQWSDWISLEIDTIHGMLPCLFKLTIKDLAKDGSALELQFTSIYNQRGWINPENMGSLLIKNVLVHDFARDQKVDYLISGKISSYLSLARKEALTIAQTIYYMKNLYNWDVCFFHIHLLDSVNHTTLAYLFKDAPFYNEKKEKKAQEHVRTAYQIVDELVKLLVESCVDKNTIVLFLADHGALPSWRVVNLLPALIESNLLSYKRNDAQKLYTIDWNKTKAFPYLEPPYIWVNKKGRDPDGIVNQIEYEAIRDDIIEALYQIKDPDTGKRIIKLALKREDAAFLGQDGERIGDVVYYLNPPYQLFDYRLEQLNPAIQPIDLMEKPEAYDAQVNYAAHAYYLPTARLGEYSVSVPLLIKGPNIKKGIEIKRPVNLIDIAPTLAHLLNLPIPQNAQGRVIYEIID